MAELQPFIVYHDRHFARHLGICNSICVKLLQIMSGVIIDIHAFVDLGSTNAVYTHRHTQTHTQTRRHTHDDSIRRNAMRCISPKN